MRGERERVADRVRELLAIPAPEGGPRRFRWDPGRRGAIALGVLVLVVAAVTLWWVLRPPVRSVPVSLTGPVPTGAASVTDGASLSAPVPVAGSPSPTGLASSEGSVAEIVVDVAGKVVHPGIYRLPAGARVFDALQAAGGARPGVDTVAINLAAPLQDGQQVVVGVSGVSGAVPVGPAPGGSSSAAPIVVDLNTATSEQLDTLPGVGPVTAQHILEWRDEHGRFDTVDQLNEVSGIGEVTFAELRPLVSV